MKLSEPTDALARCLGLEIEAQRLDELARAYAPLLAEWSVNEAGDGRGRLRVTLCTDNFAAAERVTRKFLSGTLARLDEQLPKQGMPMLGLAYGEGPPRRRWYRLAPPADGVGLSHVAGRVFPAMDRPAADLARLCGGRFNCTALGIEAADGGPARATVYFRVDSSERLQALFDAHGFPDSTRTRVMLDQLLRANDRPWPKVWIAHSVGTHGGWKLYYFARRDNFRMSDAALLDLVEASPEVRAARDTLNELLPPMELKACPNETIQLVALRLDAAEPGWTLYLAQQ